MNRLSIVLVIALVSYSLGAPENIESHSADINHDLEHSGDHELEKQNGYGDGNVNTDQSAPENPIQVFCPRRIRTTTSRYYMAMNHKKICAVLCGACASGPETTDCLECKTGFCKFMQHA
ncbi:uncharacterized protein LOC132946481 isoform X1 [Metopolophium dirhodum]|uniref:uncharacterized protein LOC132946481 isoform X1 n=1 Tax=Metopolophium dirhodum TaxID=44670 RepID=UPI00298F90B5|nr:uncharacterized protein LOC132946481 isoform X1 [Metopolophium dirhodum]